jgi:hypothetical protein
MVVRIIHIGGIALIISADTEIASPVIQPKIAVYVTRWL